MVHPPIAIERLRYRPETGQVIEKILRHRRMRGCYEKMDRAFLWQLPARCRYWSNTVPLTSHDCLEERGPMLNPMAWILATASSLLILMFS
jgi:hypothetical protein